MCGESQQPSINLTIIMSVCVYLGTFGIFNTKPHLYKSEHLHRGKPDLVDVSVSSHLIGWCIMMHVTDLDV